MRAYVIYGRVTAPLVRKDLFEFARLRATDQLKIIRYRYLPNIIIIRSE